MGADWVCSDAVSALRAVRASFDGSDTAESLNDYLAALGARVQSFRSAAGMSQKELAQAASLDRAYLSALENGKQNVSISALYRVAQGLGISLDRLLTTVNTHEPK